MGLSPVKHESLESCLVILLYYTLHVVLIVDLAVSWSNINAVLLIIIQLCQRNSPKMDETQREVSTQLNLVCKKQVQLKKYDLGASGHWQKACMFHMKSIHSRTASNLSFIIRQAHWLCSTSSGVSRISLRGGVDLVGGADY